MCYRFREMFLPSARKSPLDLNPVDRLNLLHTDVTINVRKQATYPQGEYADAEFEHGARETMLEGATFVRLRWRSRSDSER